MHVHADADDSMLVDLARGGDRAAFATLLERHRPVLVALCRRALNDSRLAEDAVQEAALQALLCLERLQQPTQFGPWLHGIGLNICRRWLRQRAHHWWSWEALLGGSRLREPIDEQATPMEVAERAELVERVRFAVTTLPAGQRAAVMLFYLAGLSYADIAAVLGIEVSAVKTRLHKARGKLRDQLWRVWQEELMMTDAATPLVEMRVADVHQPPARGDKPRHSLVVLEEVGGPRRLPIWIGQWEGDALAMTIEQLEMPRPLPYVFTARVLDAAGARLQEVQITRLAEETFFAEAIIAGPAGLQRVDARPSDALNLAVLTGAPIRVTPAVIEEALSRAPTTYEEFRSMARNAGQPEATLPTEEAYRRLQQMVSGEITGGAATIVAEIAAGRR